MSNSFIQPLAVNATPVQTTVAKNFLNFVAGTNKPAPLHQKTLNPLT